MSTEPTEFQWTWFDQSHKEQYVVRSHDFEEFVVAIEQVKSIMSADGSVGNQQESESVPPPLVSQQPPPTPAAPPVKPNSSSPVCAVHSKPMKSRTENGKTWFDHRYRDDNGQWWRCEGKGWLPSSQQK